MLAEMSSCPANFDFPDAMGRMRRQTSRVSRSSISESIEIRGDATLCFDELGTCFQGVIVADDRSNYSIVGKKTSRRKITQGASYCGCEESLNKDADESGIPVSFDIRIKDYDNPMEEYQLRRVHGRNGQICTFACSNIKFTSLQVYRGQKAAMIAQESLGHKIEGGNKSQVYCGPISVSVAASDEPTRHWVL